MSLPYRLSLAPFLSETHQKTLLEIGYIPTYDLKSVVFHEGNDFTNGKYTSKIKCSLKQIINIKTCNFNLFKL